MFKFFKNISRVNKVWKILNEKYFTSLDGKIGSTVVKLQEDPMKGNYLFVRTDNDNVKSILIKNETEIVNDLNNKIGIIFNGINVL